MRNLRKLSVSHFHFIAAGSVINLLRYFRFKYPFLFKNYRFDTTHFEDNKNMLGLMRNPRLAGRALCPRKRLLLTTITILLSKALSFPPSSSLSSSLS